MWGRVWRVWNISGCEMFLMNYISQIESLVHIAKTSFTPSHKHFQLSAVARHSLCNIMWQHAVCASKLNFHRYTNLLEIGVTGLIQKLLETCIYCLCVIGTIYWHEVFTCEHHVSVDQKTLFHLNSLTFLEQKKLYGVHLFWVFISVHFCHDHVCLCFFLDLFLFFFCFYS